MNNHIGYPPKLALVGCSWFARAAHLPAIRKLSEEGVLEIVALCSRTDDSLNEAQKIIGRKIATYKNIDELLSQSNIDLVDLVLPTPMMEAAILRCFESGKNVISEKPCASNVEISKRLLSLHAKTDLSWSVAENWPFKPTVIAISNLLKTGDYGRMKSIDFSHKSNGWGNDGHVWRTSPEFKGGYLLDSGVHFISMLRLLTGGISKVNATVGWHKSKFAADRVRAEVTYDNGASGQFIVDFTQSPEENAQYNLVIKCSNGLIKADFLNSVILVRAKGIESIIQIPDDPWVQGGVYSMLRHCCESLTNGLTPSCTPIDGMKDVAAIEAMIESSRIGQTVYPTILHNQVIGQSRNIYTYSNLFKFKPQNLLNPSSTSEVSIAIREAESLGLKVRPTGAGYNWTTYSKTQGLSISLMRLNKKCEVNLHKKTIRIDAGFLIGDVSKILALHGLCLPSLPFLTDATVGGMVSTASHGTSPNWGTLSDSVDSITLVTSKGEIIEISEESNFHLLRAARVSIGLLGVITEIELQAVDMKWVRNVRIDTNLEEFTKLKALIFEKYEHVWGHWLVGTENIVIQCLESSDKPLDGFSPYVSDRRGNWVQTYHHVKPFEADPNNIMLSMQYGVDFAILSLAIRSVNQSEFAKINSGREIELKFLKHSTASLLGPNTDSDVVLFNTFWPSKPSSVNNIFSEFESIMLNIKARPHWGKFHSIPTIEYMRKVYMHWDQFDSIRGELDPNNTFNFFD